MKDKEDYIYRAQSALWNTSLKINDQVRDLIELGVTETQFNLLTLISNKEYYRVTNLAELMGVKPSTVTAMIDKLVSNGLVSRRHDSNDRRVVLVSITEDGVKLMQSAEEKCRQLLGNYLSHLELEELEFLTLIYEKLGKIDIKK